MNKLAKLILASTLLAQIPAFANYQQCPAVSQIKQFQTPGVWTASYMSSGAPVSYSPHAFTLQYVTLQGSTTLTQVTCSYLDKAQKQVIMRSSLGSYTYTPVNALAWHPAVLTKNQTVLVCGAYGTPSSCQFY